MTWPFHDTRPLLSSALNLLNENQLVDISNQLVASQLTTHPGEYTGWIYLLIRIWKKEEHFAIILFCKQSKSEIRIEKFWFSKFDFIMLVQGLQGPRPEPIILISWSLWVSINSAWRDESFELGNRSVAPLFPEKNMSSLHSLKFVSFCRTSLDFSHLTT